MRLNIYIKLDIENNCKPWLQPNYKCVVEVTTIHLRCYFRHNVIQLKLITYRLFLQLWPIVAFPDDEINQASARLVGNHGKDYPNDLILMQVSSTCN